MPGDERESVEVSVSLPESFIEDELMPKYPAAARPSQALRMAVQNDIERLSPREISDRLMTIITETGSADLENTQRIRAGPGAAERGDADEPLDDEDTE